MKKVALVFVLAVFVPSLVLAWLAVRSLRDQQFVLERQQSLLYQGVTDSLAQQVETLLAERQHEFGLQIEDLLTRHAARSLATSFDQQLQTNWSGARVGFAVTTNGEILSPSSSDRRPEAQAFRKDNGAFLGNREVAEVYWNNAQTLNAPQEATPKSSFWDARRSAQKTVAQDANAINSVAKNSNLQLKTPQARNIQPQQKAVLPTTDRYESDAPSAQQELSKAVPADAEFQQLIGEANDGTVARFVDNKLNVLLWYRSPRDPQFVFGAQLDLAQLTNELQQLVQPRDRAQNAEICIAVLDDNAKPVALSRPGFQANWKRPFVATEIGDALPHWEMAAYLLNPAKLSESARTIRFTLGLLIMTLVLTIAVGSWLIVSDLKRQLTLARQKTDFVSNVSHELKTPLTSIRMFSELLADGRVSEPEKQRSYLNIITAETARLTRLINNVLDFSRSERGEKKYHFRDCDLIQVVRESTESYRPHLENNGFKLEVDWPPIPLFVRGDCDALAQVIVNLLSNAEKYGRSEHRRPAAVNSNLSENQRPKAPLEEVAIQVSRCEGPLPCAEVRISDRGPGVPRGSEQKIFEKFYRAHDSLGSGTQGSGLGLTLARQIARAHGGDVIYEPRSGGGSSFCLRLPIKLEASHES